MTETFDKIKKAYKVNAQELTIGVEMVQELLEEQYNYLEDLGEAIDTTELNRIEDAIGVLSDLLNDLPLN